MVNKAVSFSVNLNIVVKWFLFSWRLVVIVLTEIVDDQDDVSVVVRDRDVVLGDEIPDVLIHGDLLKMILFQAGGHRLDNMSTEVLQIRLSITSSTLFLISLCCCSRC